MRRVMLAVAALGGFAVAVVPALGQDESIKTSGNSFSPSSVTVTVGDSVTISNPSMGFHNLKWDDGTATNTPTGTAWSEKRTFAQAGTYRFYCSVHGGPNGAGMSGVVTVKDADTGTQPTTTTDTTPTQTNPPPDTTPTQTTTQPTTTDSAPTSTTEPSGGGSNPAPTRTAPSSDDNIAPVLHARPVSVHGRLRVSISLSERSRVVAVVRHGRGSFTVRFIALRGTTRRFLLRPARPGRYTIKLTATDEAGNHARTVQVTVRVRR